VGGVTEDKNWEPKILAFCCNWCSYSGADLAGLNRMKYPENIRILRVPCSARVNPQFVLRAFQRGADGVLVAGCHPGDCHYATGNYYTRRRFLLMQRFLEYNGIEPQRFQARWISGAEAGKFKETVTRLCEEIKACGPNRKLRDVK
jgi:F420-non-reducing hydrogenase iron-sulfur subunit